MSSKKTNLNYKIKDFGFNELEVGDVYSAWIFSIIKSFINKRILEVGCGLGTNGRHLASSDLIVLSDRNKVYLKLAKKRFSFEKKIHYLQLDLTNIKASQKKLLQNYKFDTVIAINVLEHIKNDVLALKNINTILSRSGRIILFVPALSFLYGSIDESFGHYRRYTRHLLRAKLKATQFEIEYIKYFNFIGIFWWFITNKLLRRRNLPPSTGLLLKYIVPILQTIETHIPIPIGQSIIVVAKKI